MSEHRCATESEEQPAINWRRDGSSVTVYDEENPEAWVRVAFEAGVPPEKRLFMVCDECGAVVPQRAQPGSGTVCGDCGAEFTHPTR